MRGDERGPGSESPDGASAFEFPEIEARPRNWMVPVVLLMLREWNSYGYELMERLTEYGFEPINAGTLYRTLRQMERQGYCESSWETSKGGPARRIYSVTGLGEAYLDFWVEALKQYQHSMDAFLRLYAGKPGATRRKEDA